MAYPTLTRLPLTGESRHPCQSMAQLKTRICPMRTSSSSIRFSVQTTSMIDSHSVTRSTRMTISSRRWPSSPPSAARQTSRGSRLRRPARESLPQSSPTGLRRQERDHQMMGISGLKAFTGCRKLDARAEITQGVTTRQLVGLRTPGLNSLASSTTVVAPSNFHTTTTMANSQTSSLPARTTASCTCSRTQACCMRTVTLPWLQASGST